MTERCEQCPTFTSNDERLCQLCKELNYRNEEWLRQKRVDEKKTTEEMANEADVDRGTIGRWLRKHDIKNGGPSNKNNWSEKRRNILKRHGLEHEI